MRCMTAIAPAPIFFLSASGAALAVDINFLQWNKTSPGRSTGEGGVSQKGNAADGLDRVVYTFEWCRPVVAR
ncbi:hypothetical protein GCM10023329_15660 [Streptomyces sanyensis]|uniref:Uncharacterized protein n=1 Tax=Streptomyces sanyensis TaxID=568869 RepID=A0ABP8ZYD3_9ACTN